MKELKYRIYCYLVNRVPAIRKKYMTIRNSGRPGARVWAWLCLFQMNLSYLVHPAKWNMYGENLWDVSRRIDIRLSESNKHKRKLPKEFAKELMQYDVISFDVFDTLILRNVDKPTDVFFFLGLELDYPDFKALRIKAEQEAREICYREHGHREVTVFDIYRQLERETGVPVQTWEREYQLEQQICTCNPYMKMVYEILQKAGKKIIITSDMYFKREQIEGLLGVCGYTGWQDCFVSCEYGKSKSDGTLFGMIEKSIGENLRYAHIGDNRVVDVERPRKLGWNSFYYESVLTKGEQYRPYDMSNVMGSIYRGLVNNRIHNGKDIFSREYEFGYIYGGIMVLGYCQFIHQYAKLHQIDKILFLARDGDILSQVYRKLYPQERIEYVLWSRKAAVKMTTKYYKRDFLRRMLLHKTNQGYTIQRIFEEMELSDMIAECPVESGQLLMDENVGSVKEFLYNNWDWVLRHYEEQIKAGENYYTEVLHNCKKAVAVDVGWAGSGAIALRKLIREEWKLDCELYGLIAGTNTVYNDEIDATEPQLAAGVLDTYMFGQNLNRDVWKYHDYNKGDNILWEAVLASEKPQFKGFLFSKEGTVDFIYGDTEENHAAEIQAGIFDFVEDYMKFELAKEFVIAGRDAYAPMFCILPAFRDAFEKEYNKKINMNVG